MKNLLFFASDFTIGVSQVLTDQLIAIHRSGINVVAVGGEHEQQPGLHNRIFESGISLNVINGLDKHKKFYHLVCELKNIIINNNIDIVHVQNNWQLALINIAKILLFFKKRFSIIYTIHGFRNNVPIKAKIAQVIIGSALFVGADHIICMTKYLWSKFRLLSYKINRLPLGIDDDYFIPSYKKPKDDTIHLIFPAQFRVGKNHDLIIRAFGAYVRKTNDNQATLTLPGKGDLLDEMKNLAKELGIANQVVFPGLLTKPEIKQYYLNANIAVVGSNSETFGQSIVEPFVLGRCVISTPVGIATEIIENGINGYIFQHECELTDRLIELKENTYKLEEICVTNFNCRGQFCWDNVVLKYNQLFDLK